MRKNFLRYLRFYDRRSTIEKVIISKLLLKLPPHHLPMLKNLNW
jgi:hypothetical protein